MVNYRFLPGTWRGAANDDNRKLWLNYAPAKTDLQAKKQGLGCFAFFSGYLCEWKITVTNLGPNIYMGPLSFKDTSTGAVVNTLPSVAPFCAEELAAGAASTIPTPALPEMGRA